MNVEMMEWFRHSRGCLLVGYEDIQAILSIIGNLWTDQKTQNVIKESKTSLDINLSGCRKVCENCERSMDQLLTQLKVSEVDEIFCKMMSYRRKISNSSNEEMKNFG